MEEEGNAYTCLDTQAGSQRNEDGDGKRKECEQVYAYINRHRDIGVY